MKYLLSVALLIWGAGCQQNKSENKNTDSLTTTPIIVGNDSDKHGCKASAGYTWSVLKKECIRVFEVGLRLNPKDSTLNQTVSAFVIFENAEAEEQGDVELFLPTLKDSSLILKPIKKVGAGQWSNGTLKLSQWKGTYSLEEDNKTRYEGHR
ncbi:MAG: hypothetical protein U0Y10_16175 [Spirosomataceae bacterium]